MGKLGLMFVGLCIVSVSLFSCGKKTEESASTDSTSTMTEVSTETTAEAAPATETNAEATDETTSDSSATEETTEEAVSSDSLN